MQMCICKSELHSILLRPNAVCRYVHCIVYTTVFGALAVTMHFRRGNNPQNCPFPSGLRAPTQYVDLGPTGVRPKWHVARVSRFSAAHRRVSLYFTMGLYMPLPQNAIPLGRSGFNLIHVSLGPPEFINQTVSRSVHPFFAGLTVVSNRHTQTYRQTDRPRYISIAIGRILCFAQRFLERYDLSTRNMEQQCRTSLSSTPTVKN